MINKKEKTGMNQKKLSILLEQNRNLYTKTEQKLYEYIIENLDKVMYFSLTELSDISDVGEATILRFCRKIGFKGYQDFKIAVAQELTLMTRMTGDETFIEKIRINMINVLNDTYELIDEQALKQGIKWISESKDVIIFGVGHSGLTANDLQSRFLRIGKKIEVITDPHFQIMRASSVDENSVIITISRSGSTKDIIDAVTQAKKYGAKVIAITDYVKSPLTKQSDLVLLTAGKENSLDGGSLVAKVSQLYIVDLICTGYSIEAYDYTENMKDRTAKAVSDKQY
ncbi:transcriptional regulator, RpiR family [Dethiosulfatibacter aminovorans DSM 17477]|uniref:Transcriptional regulator, RpiR family n=1 Tax=Dethiosulfatibacter aminovorans DSM 17477 TaxID=1121476 RepID=A0A1M6E6J3_9FIRM|nr:MurR/RpiR family transcriptional regulator [Dethiosulfatibacter aminovorans]SHI81117.1 transcriptional regulator, RpiR family [Dethiosulfatibacter aminovorans DSM 17477]